MSHQPTEDSQFPPGSLRVVATPIGNLADISPRALNALRTAELILCEDTRHSLKLLRHYDIHRPLLSFHEHNERHRVPELIDRLRKGESIALISDAGTPNISDPGFPLVRACHAVNIPVVPVPGPCALVAALSVSGLPTHPFLFAGFLPPKSAARIRFLESHRDTDYTVIVYESCHRLEKFLREIGEVLGPDRWISVARELTKSHEGVVTGPQASVLESLAPAALHKGEAVVLLAPASYRFEYDQPDS